MKKRHYNPTEACNYLNSMAVKYIIQELIDGGHIKGGGYYGNIENILIRSLSMFKASCEAIDNSNGVDIVGLAEIKTHLKVSIKEPDMYFVGNWAKGFDNQHFLHNFEWAKDIIDDKDGEEKEVDTYYKKILKSLKFCDM